MRNVTIFRRHQRTFGLSTGPLPELRMRRRHAAGRHVAVLLLLGGGRPAHLRGKSHAARWGDSGLGASCGSV